MRIEELYYYPIKSLRGIRAKALDFDAFGPKWDREWMLVDRNGYFLSQRLVPQMATIEVEALADGFRLAHGSSEVRFGFEETTGETSDAVVWASPVPSREVNPEVSNWLSEVLEKPVRLVRMMPEARRPISNELSDRFVRFVDSSPVLVISRAAHRALEERANEKLDIARFRPNLVISGAEAHAEDGWPGFKAGSLEFDPVKACSRCKIVNVDPLTGEVGREPLRLLSTYRRTPKGVTFGFYYAHRGDGRVSVGDQVTTGEPAYPR